MTSDGDDDDAPGAAGQLTAAFLSEAAATFASNPKNRLAENAMHGTKWGDVLINRAELQRLSPPLAFSTKLDNEMKITNQKASGRCWLFACLNWLRREVVKRHNLPDTFELSQPYLFFYDKLEKCNYFLEQIVDTRDEPVDGRLVQHLLGDMTCDGGQWDMIANLVAKYGVVPKEAYVESEATGASWPMNRLLQSKLRGYARTLRGMHAEGGASAGDLRAAKRDMMEEVYRILCIHMGTPPTEFDFAFHDKDKKYGCFPGLTPLRFVEEHVGVDLNDYVSVVNDPRNEYDATMTVSRLGNVVGGRDVFYVNAAIGELSDYARKMLDDGQPVWFGCDVGKESSMKKNGIMSTNIFDYRLVFDVDVTSMSKEERLTYGESEMTHAMLFTGYDAVRPPPRDGDDDGSDGEARGDVVMWRVENSWGEERGDKGYDVMTQDWFEEHMYQVVVPKSMLLEKHRALLDKEPSIALPVWDPMGSLA